jgi:hypothetical protein
MRKGKRTFECAAIVEVFNGILKSFERGKVKGKVDLRCLRVDEGLRRFGEG